MKPKFKYLVRAKHPSLPLSKSVNRRCISLSEAKNVEDGLRAVGYDVEILIIEYEKEVKYNV